MYDPWIFKYINDVDSSHGRLLILASLELCLMHNTSKSSFSNLLPDSPVYLVETETTIYFWVSHQSKYKLTSSNAKSPKLQPIYMFPNVNVVCV